MPCSYYVSIGREKHKLHMATIFALGVMNSGGIIGPNPQKLIRFLAIDV